MTVCIAAISSPGKHIVLATDRQISMMDFAADDAAIKHKALHRRWATAISADDITQVMPVVYAVKDAINTADVIECDLPTITRAFEDAYQHEPVGGIP